MMNTLMAFLGYIDGPYSIMDDLFVGETVKRYKIKTFESFRKISRAQPLRRLRCRWRQRESRRAFAGLSSVVDEMEVE